MPAGVGGGPGQGSKRSVSATGYVTAHPVALKYCTESVGEYSTCVESNDLASYACEKSNGPLTAPFTVSTRK